MNVCCKDILELPLFQKHGNIIAGQNCLDRSVRWVYLLETMPAFSSIYEWLKGDELLFVTGLYIKDDEYKLLRLIEDSLQAQISGLVIFIDGPYLTNISSDVIEHANKLGLPIFTLPWHVKYLDRKKHHAPPARWSTARHRCLSTGGCRAFARAFGAHPLQ